MDRKYNVITFFSKNLYVKIVIIFIKATLKDSRKVGRIRNDLSKWNLYLHFLI